MKRLEGNIGRIDKNIRLGLTVILFVIYNQFQSEIFLMTGAIIATTVVMGWCPVYFLIGYKTCAKNKNIN